MRACRDAHHNDGNPGVAGEMRNRDQWHHYGKREHGEFARPIHRPAAFD